MKPKAVFAITRLTPVMFRGHRCCAGEECVPEVTVCLHISSQSRLQEGLTHEKEPLAGQRKTLKLSWTFIYNGVISHNLTAVTPGFEGRNLSLGLDVWD